jgi:uncharacterized protein YndB with AHSA1/START domain
MSTPLSVVVEREFAHPPEKVWRALTTPHLIEEWLMKNDFALAPGHRFTLRAEPRPNWSGILDCAVLEIEPHRTLSYSWGAADSVVTWTLTPAGAGTHLRMEHSGFSAARPQNYQGAKYGWPRNLDRLEQILARPQ